MENVPTDRELEALKVLWKKGRASVREILGEINAAQAGAAKSAADGDALAYTTVLSLLQVMEQKGLVGHRKQGKTYLYSAKIAREPTFRKLAAGFLQRVFEGAVDEYLVHALNSSRPSKEEIERLEQAIAEAKARSHGPRH
jgi:BlaI family penicillinase repressor